MSNIAYDGLYNMETSPQIIVFRLISRLDNDFYKIRNVVSIKNFQTKSSRLLSIFPTNKQNEFTNANNNKTTKPHGQK
jgi:hypothetical protein